MPADTTTVIHSTCMMSHSGCGVIVHVRDGRVVKVEGDPDHPVSRGSLCPKGLSAVLFQNHPDRLLHPMKRAGERGEGRWERISWDEALDTIASRLADIRGQYGPEAVAVTCGTGRPILQFLRRYGNVLGTSSPKFSPQMTPDPAAAGSGFFLAVWCSQSYGCIYAAYAL